MPAVVNCASYSADICQICTSAYPVNNGQCTSCNIGYRKSQINTSKCILLVPNCATYFNDVCTSCVDSSYLLKYNTCNACASGYRISNLNATKCIPAVSYCSSYINDVCKSCYTGFKLVKNLLNSCQVQYPVKNCASYNLPSIDTCSTSKITNFKCLTC